MFYGHEGFYLQVLVGTSGWIYSLILVILDLRSARGLMLRSKAGVRSMHLGPRPDKIH